MSLRQGTRKDYTKLANDGVDGVDGTLIQSPENRNGACVGIRKQHSQQQQKRADEGDEVLENGDHSAVDSEHDGDELIVSEAVISDSESDDELREAEVKLQLLRKQHKILQKQEKRQRIAKETAELEKALSNLKKGKQPKKDVTVASLRSMGDIVQQVDRLMDQNMSFKNAGGSSSDSEAESSDVVREKRSSKSAVRSIRSEKRTSGKSKNLLDSDCEFPQKWPHNFLNPHFVNCKDRKTYEDLSMSEFCAAYMTILEKESDDKLMHRVAHLKELMYLSTRYKWRSILDYHGACLLEIERGQLKWGESFQLLQSTTLAGGLLVSNNRGGTSGFHANRSQNGGNNAGRSEGVVFCKGYQRGTCQQPQDHYGQFYGENRFLKHICGKCWINTKAQMPHPETSDECPLKEQ